MAISVDFKAENNRGTWPVSPRVLPISSPKNGLQSTHKPLLSDATILRISTALQSSLQTADIIQAFALEIRRLLPKVSIRYSNKAHDVLVEDGSHFQHRTSYELNLVGDSLGEIAFYRQRAFTEKDEALIEILLCALIYPLRNSLLYQQALQQALKDPLTGVNNRASMNAYLKQQVSITERHKASLSVIMFDVDKFKNINDTFGHLVGDLVLRKVANAITQCTRNSDVVFRFGGEEFVVVLSNTNLAGALLLAERIRCSIEELDFETIGGVGKVTVSGGVTEYTNHDDPNSLLSRCDKLMYSAKKMGRNCIAPALALTPEQN